MCITYFIWLIFINLELFHFSCWYMDQIFSINWHWLFFQDAFLEMELIIKVHDYFKVLNMKVNYHPMLWKFPLPEKQTLSIHHIWAKAMEQYFQYSLTKSWPYLKFISIISIFDILYLIQFTTQYHNDFLQLSQYVYGK